MIAYIHGTIIEKDNVSLVVDVNGIGYELFVTHLELEKALINQEQHFYTYHSIRENAEELYGFSNLSSKRLFELLISVQGVGPKAALAILSLSDSETVRNAIASSESKFISQASGVGKKTAERISVDLHDKVGLPSTNNLSGDSTVGASDSLAMDALMSLGFNFTDATAMLRDVPAGLSIEDQVKTALKRK